MMVANNVTAKKTYEKQLKLPIGKLSKKKYQWTIDYYRWIRPDNEFPGYDTKQSDGEVPVILDVWVMLSTPSLLSPQVHFSPDW